MGYSNNLNVISLFIYFAIIFILKYKNREQVNIITNKYFGYTWLVKNNRWKKKPKKSVVYHIQKKK